MKTAMTISIGDVMSTDQRQKPIGKANAGSITPGRLSRYVVSESQGKELEAGQEEWRDRLRSLEQWICELLIKNQQLRMALESAAAPETEKH
jgi:hypothetical protein